MAQSFEDLPDWIVEIDEVSAGVYKLRALHKLGPSIEYTGLEPEKLIERARVDALDIERSLNQKAG